MPKVALTSALIHSSQCQPSQRRLDLFDTKCKGLMVEVRPSGGKTYYLRYRTSKGVDRQLRLADALDISLQEARAMADKIRHRVAIGEDPHEERRISQSIPTLSQFFRQTYLVHARSYKRSWKTDESLFRNHIEPTLGRVKLDELTRLDVMRLHQQRRESGAAAASANRLVILLRYLFNLALKWEVEGLQKNPAQSIPLFEDPPTKERYLSAIEAQSLYKEVLKSENPMLKYIVPFLILTGARKQEVLKARWQDFNLLEKVWRIPMTKAGRSLTIPISDAASSILQQVPRIPHCDYVFANEKTRKPFTSIFGSWDTARTHAGLKDVRMHDLRHSFASFLVNKGRSLYEVQKLLGHTQLKTTQRYAHLSQTTLREAVNDAASLITPNQEDDVVLNLNQDNRQQSDNADTEVFSFSTAFDKLK